MEKSSRFVEKWEQSPRECTVRTQKNKSNQVRIPFFQQISFQIQQIRSKVWEKKKLIIVKILEVNEVKFLGYFRAKKKATNRFEIFAKTKMVFLVFCVKSWKEFVSSKSSNLKFSDWKVIVFKGFVVWKIQKFFGFWWDWRSAAKQHQETWLNFPTNTTKQ